MGNEIRRDAEQRDEFMLVGEYGVWDLCTSPCLPSEDYPGKKHCDFPLDFVPPGKMVEPSKKEGMFNGFRITLDPTQEKVAACEPGKYFLIIDMFRGPFDYQRPKHHQKFKDRDRFFESYFDGIMKQIETHPGKVWGVACGERDGCCAWPAHAFRDKKEAYCFWKTAFFKTPYAAQEPDKLFSYLRERKLDLRKINIMALGSMLFSMHHYFDWGFRFVWLERGCGLSNVQLGIAFARGAARQYGGLWGLDCSTHHPHLNQCTWYDKEGRRRNGWSESLMLRTWMVGFLSGAKLVHEETSDYTHWVFDEKGNYGLSLAGQHAKRFADFALRNHTERGETYAPIALLLNYYHGFDACHSIGPRRSVVWRDKLPYTAADANISSILDFFFPGHNQSWGMFDGVHNPSVPWESQWECLQMLRDGYDMRPHEAGHLVGSPFGDCLDVLVDTADSKPLQRYPVIFLGGEQELPGEKATRLLDYLRGGGTIIASITQLPDEIRSAAGIREVPSIWYGAVLAPYDYDLTESVETGEKFGGMRYEYTGLEVKKGKILGVNHRKYPLIWEIPCCGKGKIVLTGVPYSQDCSRSGLLPLFKHIFGRYIRKHLLALAEPATLELIVNRGEGFLLVAAFNNAAEPWTGEMTTKLDGIVSRSVKVHDIWNEADIFTGRADGTLCFKDSIPAFELKVYRLGLG